MSSTGTSAVGPISHPSGRRARHEIDAGLLALEEPEAEGIDVLEGGGAGAGGDLVGVPEDQERLDRLVEVTGRQGQPVAARVVSAPHDVAGPRTREAALLQLEALGIAGHVLV